jgi:hypothetical protein
MLCFLLFFLHPFHPKIPFSLNPPHTHLLPLLPPRRRGPRGCSISGNSHQAVNCAPRPGHQNSGPVLRRSQR